jgi:hypothetical protein
VNAAFAKAAGEKRILTPLLSASPYLDLCGNAIVGYLLLQQAVIAWDKLQAAADAAQVAATDAEALRALVSDNDELRYYYGKVKTAAYFCASELPQVQAAARAIRSADLAPMEMLFDGEELSA